MTLILFVWRDAQHPEIYADILVSDNDDVMVLNIKDDTSYPSLP